MIVVRSVPELRHALDAPRRSGMLGFVPTMGALHRGHAALFAAARRDCSHVVASVFVNPRQFNDPADLAAYPRPEEADVARARHAGVDTLFIPAASDMFPDELSTAVRAGSAAAGFEGEHRPGHFDGVALVCLKLFSLTRPHRVYLGQKDAQQVAVIRQMVRDFDLELAIVVTPTVRDVDGVALSSRNARLSPEERSLAARIPVALEAGLQAYITGDDVVDAARRALEPLAPEYLAVANFQGSPTLVVAVRLGATRLIDNVPLDHPELAALPAPAGPRRGISL